MKALSIGNMAADGINTTIALRGVGVDAHLLVNRKDFACAYPEWEMGDWGRDITVNGNGEHIDPYSPDIKMLRHSWRRPNWIGEVYLFPGLKPLFKHLPGLHTGRFGRYVDPVLNWLAHTAIVTARPIFARVWFTISLLELMKGVSRYDVVEAHVPYPVHLQWMKTPYVVYEAGWIRSLVNHKYVNSESKIALRGYRRARAVIYTNPDMHSIFKQHFVNVNTLFSPFAIDTDRYSPQPAEDVREVLAPNGEFLILGMSRQTWGIKGSDVLIQAFSRLHKTHRDTRLILMRWGDDLDKSEELIRTLELEGSVTWLPFMPKSKLVLIYNAVDLACDQFLIGCWGTSFPECMACGTPTLMYWNREHIQREFGTTPPVESVQTVDELHRAFLKYYENKSLLEKQGGECREWIKLTHSLKLVGDRHKEILEAVLKQ